MTRRSDRVEDLLRAELSALLARAGDPRMRLTTVTRVHVSGDLRQAFVGLSVLGDDRARADSLEAVRHAKGYLRSQLAHRLRNMKALPDLTFELDRGAEHSQRISDLLDAIKSHDERT